MEPVHKAPNISSVSLAIDYNRLLIRPLLHRVASSCFIGYCFDEFRETGTDLQGSFEAVKRTLLDKEIALTKGTGSFLVRLPSTLPWSFESGV